MLRRIIVRWVISAVILILVAKLVPGVKVTWISAILGALVLGFINAIIKPIVDALAKPFTFATFGLLVFVINGALFLLATAIVPDFKVDNFFSAIAAAFLYGIFGAIAHLATWAGEKTVGKLA
jgi:putative membrane protein